MVIAFATTTYMPKQNCDIILSWLLETKCWSCLL